MRDDEPNFCRKEKRMRYYHIRIVALACIILLVITLPAFGRSGQSQKEVMTNASVIQLVKLGLGDAVIIQKIRQSERNFDTTNAGLAQLKAAKVSDGVILEMMNPGASLNGNTAPGKTQSDGNDVAGTNTKYTCDELVNSSLMLVDGEKRTEMTRIKVDVRAGGFVPLKSEKARAVLAGNQARLRTTTSKPAFENLALPANVQLSDYIKLAKLDVKSDRREVVIFRVGLKGTSGGLSKETEVPISIDEFETLMCRGQKIKSVRASVISPLAPGEYCMIINDTYFFDFGIDANK
jgi:hypothetical protein